MKKKIGAFGAGQFSLGTLVEGRPGTTIFQNPAGGGGGGGGAGGGRIQGPGPAAPPGKRPRDTGERSLRTHVMLLCSTSKSVLNVALSSPAGYRMFLRLAWVSLPPPFGTR